MRSAGIAAFIGALLLAAVAAPQQAPAPSFPAGTEIVTVDAVVVDRDGAPVAGLTAADFTVEEDGVVQEITAFEAVNLGAAAPTPTPTAATAGLAARTASNLGAGPGRGFGIVFDELHLDAAEAQRAREAVAAFLETAVGHGDVVALVGTHAGARWTARMPDGREALLGALSRLQGRRILDRAADALSDYEAMRIERDRDPIVTDQVLRRFVANGVIRRDTRQRGDQPDRGENLDSERSQVRARAAQVYQKRAAEHETALGLIERSVEALAGVRGRKSLVLVSGGLVNDPHLPGFRRVVSAARRANVVLYFLDARGLAGAPFAFQAEAGAPLAFNDLGSALQAGREASEGSEALAGDTGGFSIKNANDLDTGLRRIARESSAYYLLGYRPSNAQADGRFRTIRVKVARSDVSVRARRGYYAPGGRPVAAETRDAGLQRALDSPFDLAALPLRATAHVFGATAPGQSRVLLTTEVDTRALAFTEERGLARDVIEYLLVVADRASGEYHRVDRQFELSLSAEARARYAREWFPASHELKLGAGSYQARVVARDGNDGRLGSLSYDFDVPPAEGLRISTPVLSDRVREAAGGARQPEPIARRVFLASGVLHGRFEVYGAQPDAATGAPQVTAGFSVRRSDGRFLVAAPATPMQPGPDGGLSRAFGVPLDGAPAGAYELIVVVTDVAAGRAAEAREPFAIEAAAN